MRFSFVLLTIFLFSLVEVWAQPNLKKISMDGSAIVHSFIPLTDSSYLLTNGFRRIGKLDANFNLVFNKEFHSEKNKEVYLRGIGEARDNFSIVGLIHDPAAPVLTDFPFVSFLNSCYEKVWSKALVFFDNFRDTSIVNTSVEIAYTTIDNDLNVYVVTENENRLGKTGRGCAQIYKFNKLGNIVWSKPIARNWGSSFVGTKLYFHDNKLFFSASSYYPHFANNPNVLSIRSVLGILDTAGNYLAERIFTQDSLMPNFPGGLGFSTQKNSLFASISGNKYLRTGGKMDEEHLLILDSMLNTKFEWVSTSSDSFFYWNSIHTITNDSLFWAINFRQDPREGKDKNSRKNTAYLVKLSPKMVVTDSFELSFLHLNTANDTTIYFYYFSQHALIDSAFLVVIYQTNVPLDRSIVAFTLSKTGKLLNPTFGLSNYNPSCDIPVETGRIDLFFGGNDTLYLPFNHDWNYKDSFPTAIISREETNESVFEIIPNPSNGIFQVSPFKGISSICLIDLIGRTYPLPLPDGLGFVKAPGFNPGIYLLKITYQNNRIRFVKIQLE